LKNVESHIVEPDGKLQTVIDDPEDLFNRPLASNEKRFLFTGPASDRDDVMRIFRFAASNPDSKITSLGCASVVMNNAPELLDHTKTIPVAYAIIVTE